MDEANKQALLSAIRSLLIVLGSSLIAHGWVTDTQWTQIVGALTTIAPIAWGVLDKFQAEKNTQARVNSELSSWDCDPATRRASTEQCLSALRAESCVLVRVPRGAIARAQGRCEGGR